MSADDWPFSGSVSCGRYSEWMCDTSREPNKMAAPHMTPSALMDAVWQSGGSLSRVSLHVRHPQKTYDRATALEMNDGRYRVSIATRVQNRKDKTKNKKLWPSWNSGRKWTEKVIYLECLLTCRIFGHSWPHLRRFFIPIIYMASNLVKIQYRTTFMVYQWQICFLITNLIGLTHFQKYSQQYHLIGGVWLPYLARQCH